MESSRIFALMRLVRRWLGCLLWAAAPLHAADAGQATRPLRPFYLIGHGANTLERARQYLFAGANALEVDVNVLAGQTNELRVGHGALVGGGPASAKHSLSLVEYLQGLHQLARTNNLCLVYFDCKVPAATPEHGVALRQSIREYLLGSGSNRLDLTVLISVAKLKEKSIFSNISRDLGPREGVMVDGFSDPVAISRYFTGKQVTNQAFCDGIVPMNPVLSQFLILHSVRKACRLRDHEHHIRFVGTWSVNNPWHMEQYIKMGVDGIVVDLGPVWYNFCLFNGGHGLRSLTKLVASHGERLGIRPATRADNPFGRAVPTTER